ncbi:MAG: transglutaminase family protein [Hahellaceae bacterium]|nr:transglutaminase family protein [Hahellaceae bacterium]
MAPAVQENDFWICHGGSGVPGAGWLGLDPTSGLFGSGRPHTPGCTAVPQDAAPIVGAVDQCEVEFEYENKVTRIHEDPRVTRPFNDQDWSDIDALGNYVDEQLARQDVRLTLTMGGEPTFVSIDDMESLEWNTASDKGIGGIRSFDLAIRPQNRYAPERLYSLGREWVSR